MPKLNFYRLDHSAMFASQSDPRFHYCTYMPRSYEPQGDKRYPLAVLVHHSLRNAAGLRDEFADFAEENQCALLAPLFPCGIGGPDDFNNYKHLRHGGVAYDEVLLSIIEEVASVFRIETDRFLMHGFSGGGQFSMRFYLRHPDRLRGVSIAAPGTVTLPGDPRSWWVGTGDMKETLGAPLDLEALRQVPVQLVIGADDTESEGVMVSPGSSFWREDSNDSGHDRVARLDAFQKAIEGLSIPVERVDVPGVGHIGVHIQEPVKAFFSRLLITA